MKIFSLENSSSIVGWSIVLGVIARYLFDTWYFKVPCPEGVKSLCLSSPGFPIPFQWNYLDIFILLLNLVFFPFIVFVIFYSVKYFRNKNKIKSAENGFEE